SSFQLVDKPDEEPTQTEPELDLELENQGECEEYDIKRSIQGKAIATDEQATQSLLALHTPKRRSTTDQFIFQRRTSAIEEASTRPFAQPQSGEEQGDDVTIMVNLEEKTDELYQGQAGSDPGETPESRPPPE
ncbi:hypothetical protein Tco_0310676, partial [Tanacetum coccineum]